LNNFQGLLIKRGKKPKIVLFMNFVTLIGLLAAFGTTISFVPQAIKTIKTKEYIRHILSMYTVLPLAPCYG